MSSARAYELCRSAVLAFGLVLAAALTLQGQDSKKREPKRPKLDAGRDTNSAGAYHQHGMLQLAKRPQVAADAFYWAARLEPSIAEPWYGRWCALLLAMQRDAARAADLHESRRGARAGLLLGRQFGHGWRSQRAGPRHGTRSGEEGLARIWQRPVRRVRQAIRDRDQQEAEGQGAARRAGAGVHPAAAVRQRGGRVRSGARAGAER